MFITAHNGRVLDRINIITDFSGSWKKKKKRVLLLFGITSVLSICQWNCRLQALQTPDNLTQVLSLMAALALDLFSWQKHRKQFCLWNANTSLTLPLKIHQAVNSIDLNSVNCWVHCCCRLGSQWCRSVQESWWEGIASECQIKSSKLHLFTMDMMDVDWWLLTYTISLHSVRVSTHRSVWACIDWLIYTWLQWFLGSGPLTWFPA